ncbi:hypothetical protein SAY87_026999 [Trapa incisa]|uniref:N-acetyltransferase domain-containing protein n=1 Tax=Trapa incisa TaxID=236973 RepID=A0AAN7H0C8_9MYRT|nr:hypothetical protein SAY87_026999 [Trapa incisa]
MEPIDSERITVRPFEPADADDYFSWASDDRVVRNLRRTPLTARDQALATIIDVCIPHPWRRSICVDGRSVGFVSVNPGSGDHRCRADISYALATDFWGRGVATAAVKLAVARVFGDLGEVLRLQAFVDVGNRASQRVLEKAGFQREGMLRKYTYLKGELKDLYLYSLLSADTGTNSN